MNNKIYVSILISCLLAGCFENTQSVDNDAVKPMRINASDTVFTLDDAKNNLSFSKDQYLKLIDNIEQNNHLKFANKCTKEGTLCFPRSEEKGHLFMEQPQKWTNGFYPGLLWKLLSVGEQIENFTEPQKRTIEKTANYYQQALQSESKRGNTHDLGFILYDSYGEALNFNGLNSDKRIEFNHILMDGRNTLSTRFSSEYGVIKSWDALPTLPIKYVQNGEILKTNLELANPWSYPVIVDNMMNLDFLFSSDDEKFRKLAFEHAETTRKNHYYYLPSDLEQERPVAYHLIDYHNMKPGNWQGLGSISAWARGQAWSLYGFVTVVEAAKQGDVTDEQRAKFESHLDNLYNTILYFLKDDKVPLWDFF